MTRAVAEFSYAIVRDASGRHHAERALEAAGRGIPLHHRVDALPILDRGTTSWSVTLGAHEPSGFAVEERRLPLGHRLLHLRRFGATVSADAVRAAAEAISTLARDRRTIRMMVELFTADDAHRAALAGALRDRGFRDGLATGYRDTIAVDL